MTHNEFDNLKHGDKFYAIEEGHVSTRKVDKTYSPDLVEDFMGEIYDLKDCFLTSEETICALRERLEQSMRVVRNCCDAMLEMTKHRLEKTS